MTTPPVSTLRCLSCRGQDVGVHLRRAVEKDVAKRFKHTLTRKGERPRILILGSGKVIKHKDK